MDETSDVVTRKCTIFTSKIIRRYIVITFIVLTVLVFLLKKTRHLDAAVEYININQHSNVDTKVTEPVYQSNPTVENCVHNHDDAKLNVEHEVKHHFLEGFTLIIQTYRRTDLLMRQLRHYSTMQRLHKIIVVWNNIGVKPPVEDWEKHAPHPVPVVFLAQEKNTIRNRLKPFKEIETKGSLARYDCNENYGIA